MSWGNPEALHEKALATLLSPASAGFAIALYARIKAYNWKLLKQQRFGVPVISIGNITCGGTGKTPITIDIAKQLVDTGHKVGILSRGYRRLSKDPIIVVSDGKGDVQSCAESGDEPHLIAKSVPEAVVIVGSKRIHTAPLAISKFGCDILLLDDGFQHWPIARNTDIVLLDYNDEITRDRLIPAGRLREPLPALARADRVVITKVPQSPDEERLLNLRTTIAHYAPKADITACRMTPFALKCVGSSESTLAPTALNNMRVVAFSGIARPKTFENQLTELGANVLNMRSFADHHWYTHEDIENLRKDCERHNADLILTTEKDAVKLPPAMIKHLPIAALQQKVEWLGPLPLQVKQLATSGKTK